MVERWEAGEDVRDVLRDVRQSCRQRDPAPLPVERRAAGPTLAKHGEHVHHVCFTSPDLPGAVARLDEKGIELTSTESRNDPGLPWQHGRFTTKASSHGALVELAYP